MSELETDSLVRAVAAAPRAAPPPTLAAVMVVRAPRDGVAAARRVLGDLAARIEELAEGVIAATWVSGSGDREPAVCAANAAETLRRAVSEARIAIATDRAADPVAMRELRDRARRLLDASDDAMAIRLDERTRMLVGDAHATTAQTGPVPLRASIDRAIRDERNLNTRRMFQLLVPLLAVIVADTWFRARGDSPTHDAELPWYAAWLAVATVRAALLRSRPVTASWVVYSVFLVDIPLYFLASYPAVRASPHPELVAVYTICGGIMAVAVTQLLLSPRLLLAVASTMLAGSTALLALAGHAKGASSAVLVIGCIVTIALYGQSRLKTLLQRIVSETEQRAKDAEAANAELRRQVASRSRELAEVLAQVARAPTLPSRFAAGDVIESRYRVIRTLGAGGMGQVYEVERVTDGRRLALKISTRVTDGEAMARFAREAQVAAELDHPGIVSVVDLGIAASGTMFIVMELVAGTSLAAMRDRFGDVAWASAVLKQIASALAAMHARGIVHRDLKPGNVLADGDRVKITDFGLAALVEVSPMASTAELQPALTRTGAIVGTPSYMAPELVHGVRAAGRPADVFSLGVMAYELLSGSLPHTAPPVLERLAGRKPEPRAPLSPAIPADLAALVDRCLADDPEARPTADAFARSFRP